MHTDYTVEIKWILDPLSRNGMQILWNDVDLAKVGTEVAVSPY